MTGALNSDWSDSDEDAGDCDRLTALGDDSSGEGADDEDRALDEDSLRALASVIRQATQLLESARSRKRRKPGGH